MQPVFVCERPLAGVQRDAGDEGVAECVAEFGHPADVISGHASGGLDLERDHDDQVDFVSVVGAPVAGGIALERAVLDTLREATPWNRAR